MKQLSVAVLFLLGCGAMDLPLDWKKPCGGHVTAALSSVTLASDCGGAAAKQNGAGFAEDSAAPCAPGAANCQNYCRQSSMQLQLATNAVSDSRIEIRAVRLIDPNTGAVVETLTHREPQQWQEDRYVAWTEVLKAQSTVKATYKLSATTKAFGFSSGVNDSSRFAGPSKYRVEVDVAVDGVVRTLSIEASREPEVVT
jgi:hypothetical protein